MPTLTAPPVSDTRFWTGLVAGLLLAAMGVYDMTTRSGTQPRYGLALVAFGLSAVARVLASKFESPALARAELYLTGAALGIVAVMVAG
ncbi:MAG TPA: hypothetical protein VGB53_08455 [Rubricoccaceae bacterium]